MPRHPEGGELGIAIGRVVVAQDGEELGASFEKSGERFEHRGRKPGRVAGGIDVVAEEQQHVEGVVTTEARHRVAGRIQPATTVTDVAGDRDAQIGEIVRRERPICLGVCRTALAMGRVRDDLAPVLVSDEGRRDDHEQQDAEHHEASDPTPRVRAWLTAESEISRRQLSCRSAHSSMIATRRRPAAEHLVLEFRTFASGQSHLSKRCWTGGEEPERDRSSVSTAGRWCRRSSRARP